MYTTNNSFANSYLNLEGLSDLFPSFLPEGLFDIFLHICQKETIHLEISLVCLFSYLILSSGDSVSTEMWPGSFWRWSFHWNCVQLTKTLWCCSIQGNSHLTVSMQKLEKQLLNFRYWLEKTGTKSCTTLSTLREAPERADWCTPCTLSCWHSVVTTLSSMYSWLSLVILLTRLPLSLRWKSPYQHIELFWFEFQTELACGLP